MWRILLFSVSFVIGISIGGNNEPNASAISTAPKAYLLWVQPRDGLGRTKCQDSPQNIPPTLLQIACAKRNAGERNETRQACELRGVI